MRFVAGRARRAEPLGRRTGRPDVNGVCGERRPQPFRSYGGVVVAGDLLATWTLGDPHGVDRAQADEVAGLVRAALCRAGGC